MRRVALERGLLGQHVAKGRQQRQIDEHLGQTRKSRVEQGERLDEEQVDEQRRLESPVCVMS